MTTATMESYYAWVPQPRREAAERGLWVAVDPAIAAEVVCFTEREMGALVVERMRVERGRYAELDLVRPGREGVG